MYTYKTSGTCSSEIHFDLKDGKVYNVAFVGGCNGNLKGISKLVEGQDAQHLIDLLKGNTCGFKPTSCPDQLARALETALQSA
ncbi:MAG: TIGR03905 family TSCPD domain-containing protein [Firmicutes bacterium]|nr:TIGR03905 family TSCPD domain-containing protein [Bacillota bacterium]